MRWLALVCLLPCGALAQDFHPRSAPAALRAGQFERAIADIDAGLSSAGAAERAALLYWRGQAHGALGARAHALSDLDAALKGAEAQSAPAPALAAIRGALGIQYLRAGDAAQARPHLERARELAAGAPAAEAAALADLGELERAEGRDAEAGAAYAAALALAEEAERPDVAARAALALGLAARAASAAERMPDSHDKAYRLIALAQVSGHAHPRAQSWLEHAAAIAAAIDDGRALSHAHGQLARLHEGLGRHEQALEASRRAVFAAQQAGATEALYRWQWQSGRILARLGRIEEALAAYRRAQTSLVSIRSDVIVELRAQRRSYREAVGPLYLEYADLVLRRARGAGSDAQPLLRQARDAIEALKAVELEDYFQDECVAALQARQKELDQIAPRTAVLYPVILPDRVEMLVSLASGIEQVELGVGGGELAATALRLRELLEKRSTRQYLPYAQRLYDRLLRPLEPLLAAHGVDTLVLVPDGPLRSIPLAVLHDGERFMIERMAIATAPALRLIEPRSLSRQSTRVLLSGLSVGVQQFPPLPYVSGEVSTIRELLPATVLHDREFVLGSFERELRNVPYTVVHIASHGQFDSDPKKSFLLTYDGRLDMDGLERVIKQSRFRSEPVELLTLSACRTAAGDERAALGLAGVAVKAGARSALATLWYINDQASSALVSDFYRRLGDPSISKARALQLAQQALLADARYRHPGFWSPFLLIGNWL